MICNLDRVANPSPCVVDRTQFLRGNPNSNHKLGYETTRVLNEAKDKLKAYFNNSYSYIEFTPGGGSVANKRAITGSIHFHPKRLSKELYRDKILISSIEHKSINETVLKELVLRGYDIIKLPVDGGGRIRMDDMVKVVQQNKDQIALVSIMSVNNENGAKQDIMTLCRAVKSINPSILFHTDVSASFFAARNYTLEADRAFLPDVMSMSVYKLGGPHIGLIIANMDLNEEYFGTKDMESIQFALVAIDRYFERMQNESIQSHVLALKLRLKEQIARVGQALQLDIVDVSPQPASVDNIQAFLLPDGYEAKIVQSKLSESDVYVGTGSACSSLHNRGSHVVEAMGYLQGNGLLRFSFDYLNTLGEINYAAQSMEAILKQLQEIKSHEDPLSEFDALKTKKVKNQANKTNYNHKHKYQEKTEQTTHVSTQQQATQSEPLQGAKKPEEASVVTKAPQPQKQAEVNDISKSTILVIKKDDKYKAKEYKRIDLPLDLPETVDVEFTSVKLHCAELYLKGNNKRFYFKALWKNLKEIGVMAADMLAKENVIIVKRSKLALSELLRVTGVSKLIPCYILERRLFKKKPEGEEKKQGREEASANPNAEEEIEAASDNIDLERDSEEEEGSETAAEHVTPETATASTSTAATATNTNSNNTNAIANTEAPSSQNQSNKKNTHGGKKARMYKDRRGQPKRVAPPVEILEPKDDLYLQRVVSIVCGMVTRALEQKQAEGREKGAEGLRFKLTANFVLGQYFNMSRNDFQICVGQYIRDRFNGEGQSGKERVIVDLKNHDLDIQVTMYNDMTTFASQNIPGVGGLPEGTSGTGLLLADPSLMENPDYRNRLNISSLMSAARGCRVLDVCHFGDLSARLMDKYDYFILEPTQYNDATIYGSFKFFEDTFRKPVFSVTNLMTREEVQDKMKFFTGDHFRLLSPELRAKKEQGTEVDKPAKHTNPHHKKPHGANNTNASESTNDTSTSEARDTESDAKRVEKASITLEQQQALARQQEELEKKMTEIVRGLQAKIAELSVDKPVKRVLVLLSGGIDSPVAAHYLLRAGYHVDFVHFSSDIDKINNILALRNTLNKESKIFVVSFSPVQEKIVLTSEESYRTLMYKVFMVKIASNIAHEHGYDALATGNALSQVASQTIENIKCTHFHSAGLPLITPLFGFNKEDIMTTARRIDTYTTSTCDGTSDCCVMYMPKNPKTKANPNIVMRYVDEVPDEIVKNVTVKCI